VKFIIFCFDICLSFLGVKSVLVALMAAKAEVQYDSSLVQPEDVANSITDLGFPCNVLADTNSRITQTEFRVIIYLFLLINYYIPTIL